jgi:hypothetical protein
VAFVNAIETLWVVVSLTGLSLLGIQSARYFWVTFCYRCLVTKTYPVSVVVVETSSREMESVVYDGVVVIWNG